MVRVLALGRVGDVAHVAVGRAVHVGRVRAQSRGVPTSDVDTWGPGAWRSYSDTCGRWQRIAEIEADRGRGAARGPQSLSFLFGRHFPKNTPFIVSKRSHAF